uniref:Uncharacterized protein n=1 Tax=Trichogramma kaykai TaxID=54128 RepID=A0ABD2X120_9HYME
MHRAPARSDGKLKRAARAEAVRYTDEYITGKNLHIPSDSSQIYINVHISTVASSCSSHSLEDVPKKLSSAAAGKNPLHTQYAVEPERSRAKLTSIFFSYRNLGTSFIVHGTSRCAYFFRRRSKIITKACTE